MSDYANNNLPLSETNLKASAGKESITNTESLPPDTVKIVDEQESMPAYISAGIDVNITSPDINNIPYIGSKRPLMRKFILKK